MSSGVPQVVMPEYLRGHTRWDLSMLAEPGHEAGVHAADGKLSSCITV